MSKELTSTQRAVMANLRERKFPESKRITLPAVPLTEAQKEALKNLPKPKGMPIRTKLPKDFELPESMIQNFKDGGMVDSSCRGGGAALRGTKFRGVK